MLLDVLKKIPNKFQFEIILAGIKSEKVGPTFSSFNPCASLSSIATDNRKQFQCPNNNIFLNNKS